MAGDALRRADKYLARQGGDRVTHDISVINRGEGQSADEHRLRARERGNHLVSSLNPPTHTIILRFPPFHFNTFINKYGDGH